jgi:type I restriction enzyme S subunit
MEKLKGKKPGVRFPGFKDDWEQKKFGDIFSFRVTNSFSRDKLNYTSGKVRNIHYGDIHTKFATLFDLTKEHVPFVNLEVDLNRINEENYCKIGDLVITDASEDYNGVGKSIEIVNLNNEKLLAGLHTILARPDKAQVGIGFFGYYFLNEGFRSKIKKIAQGSKVLSISSKRLADLEINIPTTLPEQTRIASFFTVVDQKIAELKQKKTLLEQYKKGVMQKLFSQELRFRDEGGKAFPEWERKRLGEIAEKVNSGKTPLGGESVYTESGILFIRSQNIVNNQLSLENSTYIPEGINNTMKNSIVKANDILLNITGASLGRSCVVPKDFEIGNVNQHVCIIRIDKKNEPRFIQAYFSTVDGQNIFKTLQTGSGREGLNFQSIKNISLNMPSTAEQSKIVNFLSAIDEKINHTETQIQQTQEWKKGLLQKMFC